MSPKRTSYYKLNMAELEKKKRPSLGMNKEIKNFRVRRDRTPKYTIISELNSSNVYP